VLLALSLAASLIPACSPQGKRNLVFTQGEYIRDSYCAMIFDYRMATVGQLTIAIADDPSGTRENAAIAGTVIDLYDRLNGNSPIHLTEPFTVYVISNPDIGECYSREDRVFVALDKLDSRQFAEEMLGAGTGIGEYWVLSGLTSQFLREQPDVEVLKTWYETTDDLDMAGLFIARFNENWASEEEIQIARMSATSLLQYAFDEEKIPAEAIVEGMSNEVRTRWLASLGVNREVEYPYDGRFELFTFSHSSDCALVAQADTMRFCLNRLPEDDYFDEIPEAEFLIDQVYYGAEALESFLHSEAPSVSDQMIHDEMIIIKDISLTNRLGYTQGNTIVINRMALFYYPLHEVVHTFDWNMTLWYRSAWLAEGFAEYLGKLMFFYPQTQKHCIFEELNGRVRALGKDNISSVSYCYYLDSDQLETAKKWYMAQGRQFGSEESIDSRLYTDAVAYATMYRDAKYNGLPIGEKYEILSMRDHFENQDGLELSYTQAASFVAWLCDTYTIDRVLDVYVNDAEDGMLDGKSYTELKAAWQAYLLEKGQGITIPGQP
jgi:hypothetical protein